MCCVFTILLVLARIALIFWWFIDSMRFSLAFSPEVWPISIPLPSWVRPLLGLIFLPWTTLAYLFVFPGGIGGLDWIWLGIGLLIDIGSHSGGGYRYRHRVSRY
jgi:hypothetical protein